MRAFRLPLSALLTCAALVMAFLPAAFTSHESSFAASPTSTATSLGPDRGWINAIAFSPQFNTDGDAWVAPSGGEIYATANKGQTWVPSRAGETDPVVTGLAASPNFAVDQTVFAAADNGVFVSTNAGQNWQVHLGTLNGHYCREVVVSSNFASDREVFVSTDAGVYRSADGGLTWSPPSNQAVSAVALAGSGQDLFAGPSAGGLIESLDGGATWSSLTFPLSRTALSVAVSPRFATDRTIFVGSDSGLYVSHDGGVTWIVAPVPVGRIPAVAISPAYSVDRTVFAGSASGAGIYVSRDAGATWTAASALANPYTESLAISPAYSTDQTVFAGTAGSGIEKSTDGGTTWTPANSGLHAAQIRSLFVDAGTLEAAGTGGASYLPAPNPLWQEYGLPTPFVTGLDGSGPDLFLGTQDHSLLTSFDAGNHWISSTLPASAVNALSLSPQYAQDGTLLVAGDYVYQSHDRGSTWTNSQLAGDGVRRFAYSSAFDSDGTVFAATVNHGVYVSTNVGLSWSHASAGLPSNEIDDLLTSQDFGNDHMVFAATAGSGIYSSSNGGSSWAPLPHQPADPVVTALAWSADGRLLAGTEKGLYMLTSASWAPVVAGWSDYVTALVDPVRNGLEAIYAGTLGDGVWRFDLPAAATATPTASPVPTRTPKSSPTATRSVPPPAKTLHPKVSVYPRPPIAGQPALMTVRGPRNGRLWATLVDGKWKRSYSTQFSPDGWAAHGFVAPSGTLKISVKVESKTHRLGYRTISVKVASR